MEDKKYTIVIKALSPIHLGSGQGDVNIDAEVVHDIYGLPYFPGKRLKGLLYESATEVAEMAELSGISGLVRQEDIDDIFGHNATGGSKLIISNLFLKDYDRLVEGWKYLQTEFAEEFQAEAVLEQYTTLRYQTKIDRITGTAADTSLHNMRLVDEGTVFYGELTLLDNSETATELLALAVRNLENAGLKRNRGFGKIHCSLEQDGKNISDAMVKKALQKGGLNI